MRGRLVLVIMNTACYDEDSSGGEGVRSEREEEERLVDVMDGEHQLDPVRRHMHLSVS
jgi:hypothetical protein